MREFRIRGAHPEHNEERESIGTIKFEAYNVRDRVHEAGHWCSWSTILSTRKKALASEVWKRLNCRLTCINKIEANAVQDWLDQWWWVEGCRGATEGIAEDKWVRHWIWGLLPVWTKSGRKVHKGENGYQLCPQRAETSTSLTTTPRFSRVIRSRLRLHN